MRVAKRLGDSGEWEEGQPTVRACYVDGGDFETHKQDFAGVCPPQAQGINARGKIKGLKPQYNAWALDTHVQGRIRSTLLSAHATSHRW